MNKIAILFLFLVLSPQIAFAVDFNAQVSTQDQTTFDQILEPVMKVYNFIKYAATVLAVLFMIFAGVRFIMSGGDAKERDSAKMTATYIVVGLLIISIAPIFVSYLVG